MSDPDQLPAAVRAYIRAYVGRGRRLALVRSVGLTGCVFLGVLLATTIGDRFFQFPGVIRGGILAFTGAICLLIVLRTVLNLGRSEIDWLGVASEIEQQNDRFGQRLQTVTSRLLGQHHYRGSDEILEKLSYDVDREAADERPSRLLPARRIAGPWVAVLLLAMAAYGLGSLPDINLPQLTLRFLLPWKDLAPVTTTRLAVEPGDRDLPQGASVNIEASVSRLGGGLVWLHLAEGDLDEQDSAAGERWQKFQMNIQEVAPDPGTTSAPGGDRPATREAAETIDPPSGSDAMRFVYTLTSIDRDLKYFVSGGDARSKTYTIRALRKPAVAEFRVRYLYPPHTGRPPVTATSFDGRLEAPTGTIAEVLIVATEPLKSALLTFAGETQALVRPADDATGRQRQGRIVLSRDGKVDLGLVSTREQAGIGPATAEVKVTPDRQPIVRIGNTSQTLRLGPREILPLSYEALDDFGVESLVLRAQVGSAPPVEFPVTLSGSEPPVPQPVGLPVLNVQRVLRDQRRREGVYDMDLARLPLAVGDMVSLVLAGRDTSNQVAVSDAVHILVSPRSVSLEAYELVSELDAAALLAASSADDLEEATKRLTEGDAGASRAGRRLSAAGSSGALVRRALIRGIGREPPPELSAAMLGWIDEAQVLSASAEVLFRELGGDTRPPESGNGSGGVPSRQRPSKQELATLARELASQGDRLAEQLRIARDGQRAAVVLADLENAAATEKRGAPKGADKATNDRFKQQVSRLREEISSAGKSLGLQPSSGDFKQKLQQLVDRAAGQARGRPGLDLASRAREWSQRVQQRDWRPVVFDERLAALAQAESVRPGGDLRIARDLNLAARAAAAIEAGGDRSRPTPVSPATANAYVSAIEALLREHELLRRPNDVRTEQEVGAVTSNADKARALMEQWAGPAGWAALPVVGSAAATTNPATGIRTAGLEVVAMQAGAAAAGGDYSTARRADQTLERQLATQTAGSDVSTEAMGKVHRAVRATETISAAETTQKSLVERTAAANPTDAPAVADAQRRLADDLMIAGAYRTPTPAGSSADARDKAGEAYLSTQNRLVAVPQQLAEVLEADTTFREAAARAARAKEEADRAPADQRAAARRMAEMAVAERNSAGATLTERLRVLEPATAQLLLVQLDGVAGGEIEPVSAARDAVGLRLMPALKSLAEAAAVPSGEKPPTSRDRIDRAAAEVRQAVEAAQLAVARSQEDLALQDPLTSARWYARAAADALSRKPPDFRSAEKAQRSSIALLSQARQETLRYASGQRMMAIRTARPLPVTAQDVPAAVASESNLPPVSAWSWLSGEFRRLRPREMDDSTGLLHRSDPPGYEAAIKAYFEAIDKVKQDAEK